MKRLTILMLFLSLLVGCGGRQSSVRMYQPDQAREVLTEALDAWKSGQLASLATKTPPVRFQDDDFAAGWQLVRYQLVEPKLVIHPFGNVRVDMLLRSRQGKEIHKVVTYQIALHPNVTVQRSDN